MRPLQNKVFKFLASIKLAAPLILILAVLLASGTIVESVYSTPVAKRFVYGTWWFSGFLLLLGINVFCSAISRFPWKKHQTGFVITHFGILCILAGSLVTQRLGVDGQIALKEGEEGSVFQEEKPNLYYQTGGDPIERIPAGFPFRPPNPDRPLLTDLPEGGLLMVDRFYLNAQKQTTAREAEPGETGFPAAHVDLASSFVHENQWLFLGSKDYGHLDLGPASVFFEKEGDWKKRLAHGAKDIPVNALAVLAEPDGKLKFQTRFHGQFTPPQALEEGVSYPTGWMDMQFKLEERLAAGVPEDTYLPQPFPYQKDLSPAIHYEVIRYPDKKAGWLGYQDQVSFKLQGQPFSLAYGPRQIHLPFALHLVKFTVGFDPGTEKAASYASDVYYTEANQGTQVPAHISMNKPLHFSGYTVYQASYQALPGGKYISVFSVGKDPGIWLKYGGAIIMVFGIILMFWFKNPSWGKKELNAV